MAVLRRLDPAAAGVATGSRSTFPEAQTLAQEADVRLAGVNVGKVKKKELNKGADGTLVTIELKKQYAPIAKDTRAVLRQKTLLGETYVELAPGKASSGDLSDGGTLPAAQVEPTVELDEIFNTFDKPTRDAFQSWVKELSVAIKGRGAGDLNAALGNLGPFAEDGSVLLRTLDEQGVAVNRLVKNTGVAFGAINQRQGALRELIVNGNNTFEATASRDRALAETIRVFPTFLDESKATLARLEGFARETHPLVNQLKPAAEDLGPAVRDLADLSPDLEALFKDLPGLVRAGKKGLPALTSVVSGSEPLFEGAHVFLPELNPILSEFNFQQQVIAHFSRAQSRSGGNVRRQALPDPGHADSTRTGCSRATRRNSPSRAATPTCSRTAAPRGPALGIVSESFHCPGGKEQKDPIDAEKLPPCFVAPPSLLTGKQFIHLGKGKAPYRKPPQGLEGTAPGESREVRG